jgi:hypothetical protein
VNPLDIKTEIVRELYSRRTTSPHDSGMVGVPALASEIGASAKVVAVLCSDLARVGHVQGDGDLLGSVRLSDRGAAYYEAIAELHESHGGGGLHG